MQLISLDIAYFPKDTNGYQYMLLIGDTFSKLIQGVPLKDQTAPVIVDAFLKNWVSYLLTDQGSNVDDTLMKDMFNSLGIEKRRSSAYNSQGNGFAERNIRTVKDVMPSILLHRRLSQLQWRSVLPEIVLALNTSQRKATQCVPYDIVFGSSAVLPQDIVFNNFNPKQDQFDQRLPKEYEEITNSLLQYIYSQVITSLELRKEGTQQHYYKNIRYVDYIVGQKVWLKVKHYKTGEHRKLAPRRDGPWTVIEKLPNGVNFRIENSHKEKRLFIMIVLSQFSKMNCQVYHPIGVKYQPDLLQMIVIKLPSAITPLWSLTPTQAVALDLILRTILLRLTDFSQEDNFKLVNYLAIFLGVP